MPSGSLRVKVYAGLHPVTGRPRYIGETVTDGLLAREEAGRRLLGQVRRSRRLRSHATVDDLHAGHGPPAVPPGDSHGDIPGIADEQVRTAIQTASDDGS